MNGYLRFAGTTSADDENAKTADANCASGKVVGGGYVLSSLSGNAVTEAGSLVLSSFPFDDDTWRVTTRSNSSGGDNSYAITAWAICLNVSA